MAFMISTISELKLSLIYLYTILEKYEILLLFKCNNVTFFFLHCFILTFSMLSCYNFYDKQTL